MMTNQRPLKNYEWVMKDLQEEIATGTPGDRLASVVDLASRFGVGRSTIREALSALKAMGLLDIKQGGGTFIKAVTPDLQPTHPGHAYPELWEGRVSSLRQILEVRRVLETGCAFVAATNRTEDDLAALQEILRTMEQYTDDEARTEEADVRFHQQIAIATHNPMLCDLMASLSAKLHDSIRDMRALWFYAEKSSAERLYREHVHIYDAIAEGNGNEASARMESHITKVEQVLHDQGVGSSS
jgi:GntR family transcriptional repressor for pyruvate dehydrogenase complex